MQGRSICPVCGSRRLSPPVVRLETIPAFCMALSETKSEAVSQPTATMSLRLCSQCGHLFNANFDHELVNYRPGYENSLRGSEHFREYDAKIVEELIEENDLRGRTVVEIGCGGSEFLRILCRSGHNRGIGFDPSYSGDESENPETEGVRIIRERFESGLRDLEVDLLCSRQTLEHIEDPQDFLRNIRNSISRPGVAVFFEVPNALYTLRDGGIWDLIHEHCSYFTPQSLKKALELGGYHSIEVSETFEGQFLAARAKTGYSDFREEALGIDYLERLIADFPDRYWATVEHWNLKLKDFDRQKQKVVVWGGGAKGITFLNVLRSQSIEFIVDVNPLKSSKYIPGTGQQIMPPEFMKEYRPDVVIGVNPNYHEEIIRHMSALELDPEFVWA